MVDSKSPRASTARRIAAIDVGTNSIRLIVAEATSAGNYRILDDEKETARLGTGLVASGRLSPKVMQKAALAIARMKSIAEGYGVNRLRAIGTCAVREADNRDEFLAMVRRQAGLTVEPISAEEEARLAYRSVARAFDLRTLAAAIVDIGGGSTEAVLSSGGVVEEVYTLPLGAVRLTEQYGGPEQRGADKYQRMRRAIRKVLRETISKPPFLPQVMIGTGGTFTALADVALHRDQLRDETPVAFGTIRGYQLKRSDLCHLIDWLRELPLRARARVPGLSPERADIIVAGAAIVERLMKHLRANRLLVHDRGVRDGLLLTMLEELFPQDDPTSAKLVDPMHSVEQFAAACGYEQHHCHHVAQLAGGIFDQATRLFPVGPSGWPEPASRTILQAAALLHDVGYLINYSKHHRHSYHLIVHSDPAGFTPREIELVANVARYHRRAAPKLKHRNFAKLSSDDREIVRRLAAILRVADGLDRNHLQNVRGVTVQARRGTVHFVLDAAQDPAVDIWGAVRKSGLFDETFGVKTRFEWARPEACDGTNATTKPVKRRRATSATRSNGRAVKSSQRRPRLS